MAAEIDGVGLRIDIHVHHHFNEPLRVVQIPFMGAVRATLVLRGVTKGENGMASITVDTTTGQASIAWEDDKGDVDAAQPDGSSVVYTSDNPAAATIDATSGQITPVAEGDTNIGVTLAGADGNPLTLADGSAFPTPAPVSVHVGPGPADQAVLSVNS